jgi:hypothetical protein
MDQHAVIYISAYVHAIHVDLDGKDELSSIHSAFGVEGDEPVLLPDKITLLEIFDNKISRAFYDIPKRMYQQDFQCVKIKETMYYIIVLVTCKRSQSESVMLEHAPLFL